jgi:FSR family fosmidomycin resistance protein-like MFS transporter
VLELSGAVGALTLGTWSDTVGRKRVLMGAVSSAPVLMLLFLFSSGLVRLVVLAALGFVTLATTPVLIAVMIDHSGTNPATANGTFMMMSFAIRGLIVLLVGAMGDAIGLQGAFLVCAAMAILGIPFVLWLPPPGEERVC